MSTPVKVKDMTSFKWMMLNITGHDFMHDFMLSSERTQKGVVKGENLFDKTNKTVKSLSKILQKGKSNARFMTMLIQPARGGGNKNQKGGGWRDRKKKHIGLWICIDEWNKATLQQVFAEISQEQSPSSSNDLKKKIFDFLHIDILKGSGELAKRYCGELSNQRKKQNTAAAPSAAAAAPSAAASEDGNGQWQEDLGGFSEAKQGAIQEYLPNRNISKFFSNQYLEYIEEFQITPVVFNMGNGNKEQLEVWFHEITSEYLTHEEMVKVFQEHFSINETNRELVPRILRTFAQGSVTSILSPAIVNVIDLTNQISNVKNNIESGAIQKIQASMYSDNIFYDDDDDDNIELINYYDSNRLSPGQEHLHYLFSNIDGGSTNTEKNRAENAVGFVNDTLINNINNSLYKIITSTDETDARPYGNVSLKILDVDDKHEHIQYIPPLKDEDAQEGISLKIQHQSDTIVYRNMERQRRLNEAIIEQYKIENAVGNGENLVELNSIEDEMKDKFTIEYGQYSDGYNLFSNLKNILESNLQYKNEQEKTNEYKIFLAGETVGSSGEIEFDYSVIENTVNMFYNELEMKFINFNEFIAENNTSNFLDLEYGSRSESFIRLIRIINTKLIEVGIRPIEISEQLNELFKSNYSDFERDMYRIIIRYIHPDKTATIMQQNGLADGKKINKVLTTIFMYFKKEMIRLPNNDHRGGGRIIQTGGGKNDKKIFAAANTLLCKAILENSLTLLECVTGNKELGYFPEIKDPVNTIPIDQTGYKFIKNYKGLKPVFFSIFSGKGMRQKITDTGLYDNNNGSFDWDRLASSDEFNELKNLLARRILLNMQVLILYVKCTPTTVRLNPILEALFLKSDKVSRSKDIIMARGYRSRKLGGKPTDKEEIKAIYGREKNLLNKIKRNRLKFFGFLFDRIDYDDVPLWFSGTADDILQDTFNIVLERLHPDRIFLMEKLGEAPQEPRAQLPKSEQINTAFPSLSQNSKFAYVINNAVPMINPQDSKLDDPRFKFINLSGRESKGVQFCPVTSIADSQPLCSIKSKKAFDNVTPQSVNYSMEMGLEVDTYDSTGNKDATWSYYVNLEKINADRKNYDFYISGTLSLPTDTITIGDKISKLDLREGPLSAVSTFYSILQSINKITKKAYNVRRTHQGPRIILREFFYENMKELMRCSIKKSIGDYGQEFTAISKYATLSSAEEYNANNNVPGFPGSFISLPYNGQGNSLRIMVANDRPSAYRGIFLTLYTLPDSINSRSIMGYYKEDKDAALNPPKSKKKKKKKTKVSEPKNTLVFSHNVLDSNGLIKITGDDPVSSDSGKSPDDDDDDGVFAPKNVGDSHYNKYKLRNRILRRSTRLQKKLDDTVRFARQIKANKKFAKWIKGNGFQLQSAKTLSGKNHNIALFNEWRESLKLPPLSRIIQKGGRKKQTRKKRKKKKRKTKMRREKIRKTRKNKKKKKRTRRKNKL